MENVINNIGGGKVCKRCGRELRIESFSTDSRTADGHRHICKECEHDTRSKGQRKSKLSQYTKEQLLEELNSRGLDIMASPTPRELMLRLKKFGYSGKFKYVETRIIDLDNLDE